MVSRKSIPVAIVAFTIALLAFVELAGQTAPSITRDSITAIIGSQDDARAVFSLVLAHLLVLRPSGRARAYFLSSQLSADWLPQSDRASIVLLADAEARVLAANCGDYWRVSRIERAEATVTLHLSLRCSAEMLAYEITHEGNRWRLGPAGMRGDGGWGPGIGSGFVGERPAECSCPSR